MEGTPPLTGRALPNLINAVKMLKSKPQSEAGDREGRPYYGMVLTLTLKY